MVKQPVHFGDFEDIKDENFEKDSVLVDYFKYRLAQNKKSNHI